MNIAFKQVVAVTALAAAGAAQAYDDLDFPHYLDSASGRLVLSNDAKSGLTAANVFIATPATLPTTVVGLPGAGSANSATHTATTTSRTLDFQFNTLTVDRNTQSLVNLIAPNAFIDLRRSTVDDNENVITRSVYLRNFDWNLTTSTISANLYTFNSVSRTLVDLGKQAVFTATIPGIVGGTQGKLVFERDPAGYGGFIEHASGGLAGELKLNLNTADLILSSLNLSTSATDPVASLWRQSNWGTATFAAPPVPEPSTWALFGIGLLALGAAARQRSKA